MSEELNSVLQRNNSSLVVRAGLVSVTSGFHFRRPNHSPPLIFSRFIPKNAIFESFVSLALFSVSKPCFYSGYCPRKVSQRGETTFRKRIYHQLQNCVTFLLKFLTGDNRSFRRKLSCKFKSVVFFVRPAVGYFTKCF